MRRKAAVITSQLDSDYWPSPAVKFSRGHAFNFAAWALVNGYVDTQIRIAWRSAFERTVADVADGFVHCPEAYWQGNAKRILRDLDPRTRFERISDFYASRERITEEGERRRKRLEASGLKPGSKEWFEAFRDEIAKSAGESSRTYRRKS